MKNRARLNSNLFSMCVSSSLACGITSPLFAQAITPIQTPESVRAQRESNSSQAITTAATTADGMDEATELDILRETRKRLRDVERDDPARALADYKKFFAHRTPHAAVGIEAASKIAQLRYATKDVKGALFTCDYMMKKYASNRNAGLLLLAKAAILSREKRNDEAAKTLIDNAPRLVALTPDHYPRVEDVLLRLGQSDVERPDEKGKEGAGRKRAGLLYAGLEQVYVKWLEGGTLAHTWQKFEALQAKYQQAGETKRADALLPRAAAVLLKMTPTDKNPEGADVSLEAARWLMSQSRAKEARLLYDKVPSYGNGFVSQVAELDLGQLLIQSGDYEAAQRQLKKAETKSPVGDLKIAQLCELGQAYYRAGNFERSHYYIGQALAQYNSLSNAAKHKELDAFISSSNEFMEWMELWKTQPLICETDAIHVVASSAQKPRKQIISIQSFRNVPLTVSSSSKNVKASVDKSWKSEENDYYYEQRIIVDASSSVLNKDFQDVASTITVSSPNFPDFKVSIPVRVRTESIIKTSSSAVFFGMIKESITATASIKLSSLLPFHIVRTSADSDSVQIEVQEAKLTGDTATQYLLKLKLLPNKGKHFYEGKIRIVTDSQLQQIVEIPYIAQTIAGDGV